MEQYRPDLESFPSEEDRRDAIHVAVIPLIAASRIDRGGCFFLTSDGRACECSVDYHARVGVASPFIIRTVEPGERFWAVLWPNTITNLRHVWEHPAFKPKPPERNNNV